MRARWDIPSNVYKMLIVLATIIWGLSFVIMKDAVDVLQPATLIGVRFIACGILLTIIFHRRMLACLTKDYLVKGFVVGVLIFVAFWVQTIGLAHTTPGKNAFLTAVYCVIVPFAWWFAARRKPSVFNVIAAVLCVAGIGLVSGAGAVSVNYGDMMTLLAAVFFAIHIVYVACVSKGMDVIVLTVYQFIFGGLCGLVVGFSTEGAPNLAAITPEFIFNMVYLIVFASCVALLIQNVSLAHVPPMQASLLLSLESVFGVLFSVLLYGEEITIRLLAGFALIFIGIVVSEVFPSKEASWRKKTSAR